MNEEDNKCLFGFFPIDVYKENVFKNTQWNIPVEYYFISLVICF